jgi:signal transduction histidine kinase
MNEIETLKAENEKLKSMNAVKSDLISISAHQLRTSLSALKWILKMFIDQDLGHLTTEQSGFIKKAFDSNERMIALVNDLLTLNHSEDTTIAFNFQKVDILKLIEQTLFEFSGEVHKKGLELIFLKPEESIPEINCDTEMIRVVLQNLVENGLKYSTEGHKVLLSLKYNKDENSIRISIHDNGIGINQEDQNSIFNKFFRAKNAVDKDYIGSGLGLFTTKNIVERHNGKIWFESTPSHGTTFFVTLPIDGPVI